MTPSPSTDQALRELCNAAKVYDEYSVVLDIVETEKADEK